MPTERTTTTPESREGGGRFTREGEPPVTRPEAPARGPSADPARAEVTSRRDLVRWGPIFAGLVTTIATLVVLTVLGLAIGLSAFEPNGLGDADTAATIWGIASAVLAFFAGGIVASGTSIASERGHGALQGMMVGVAAIAAVVLLVGLGLGNTLGAAATNLDQLGTIVNDLQVDADQAAAAAESAFEEAESGAWATLVGLLVALGAATAGGVLGVRRRADAEDNVR